MKNLYPTNGRDRIGKSKRVFPVCLLMEDRQGLVVGGGKVAVQKTNILLSSGARVRVVCEKAAPALTELASAGRIDLQERGFEEADVEGAFVVYAATNDRAVNARVLALCQKLSILCCSVDKGWVGGDFVTPAVFRKESLTVAVSTGGRSCRRSRLIKESVARHAELLESAELLIMGTSHDLLSLEERSPYHLTEGRLQEAGTMLMHAWGVHEFMLLNTCNRVELIAIVSQEPGVDLLLKRIMGFDGLDEDGFYIKRGGDAFRHAAATGAGLLSQTPGEKHIVAQLKEALGIAQESGWAGGMMQEWISSTLHISKKIRSVTGPLLHGSEIEDLCLKYLESKVPQLDSKRILVLGSGMVGRGCVERFLELGCQCDWCYHQNKPDLDPAWEGRVDVTTFNGLRERLSEADVVVCATGAPGYVLHSGHVPFFDQEKRLLIIDLAVPRNVAPELDHLATHTEVADMDDLKHWYRREAADLAHIVELSNTTISEHIDLYEKLLRSFQGGNT